MESWDHGIIGSPDRGRGSLLQVIMVVVEVVMVVVDQMHAPRGDLSCKSPCHGNMRTWIMMVVEVVVVVVVDQMHAPGGDLSCKSS